MKKGDLVKIQWQDGSMDVGLYIEEYNYGRHTIILWGEPYLIDKAIVRLIK